MYVFSLKPDKCAFMALIQSTIFIDR
jgi:hypothetical protein